MNKHYTQIAEFIIPYHDGEERQTKVYVFDVDDEKAEEIYEIAYEKDINAYDHMAVRNWICNDLGAYDDYGVPAGAPFHRYSARFAYPHTVYLTDELAYNV